MLLPGCAAGVQWWLHGAQQPIVACEQRQVLGQNPASETWAVYACLSFQVYLFLTARLLMRFWVCYLVTVTFLLALAALSQGPHAGSGPGTGRSINLGFQNGSERRCPGGHICLVSDRRM